MAQIIASIERMEQRRPASRTASPVAQYPDSPSAVESAESASEELQTLKNSSTRGMNIKSLATARTGRLDDGGQEQAPRITPKKRWIQLWNAQLYENTAPSSTDSSAAVDNADGVIQADQPEAEASISDHNTTDTQMKDVSENVTAPPQLLALAEAQITAATAVTPTSALASAVEELRVKTPMVVESSHLSPPLDRNSPTTSASISPSTKAKESASEEPPVVKAALREPPLSTASATSVEPRRRTSSPMPSLESQAEEPETSNEATPQTETRELQQPQRKRSLERKELLTEEEQRRADRRRKRKTNWDVGDPRNGSSGGDSQASNASTKFPAGRPSWRHSHSMDTKPYFHTSHRSSFHNHSSTAGSSSSGPPASASGRRSFYHSTSLPTEHRSRSLSRPSSTRYNSSSGSFR